MKENTIQMFWKKKKPYKCTICDYNWAFKSVLANHISRVHEGIKQYVCEICGTRFVNISKLIANITTNHEGKKHAMQKKSFKCGSCGSGFTSNQKPKAKR